MSMEEIVYRIATSEDIDLLVVQRLKFVDVEEDEDIYSELKKNCYTYFMRAFSEDTCDVVLAEDKGKCIGTGIVFYYDSVPSTFNVTGKNAYITSMYVEPEYRRKGIGSIILKKVLDRARERGYCTVFLNTSKMGKIMYKKTGFVESRDGMFLIQN